MDYVGVALLACAGTVLANVRWPLAGAGWAEPPVLRCGLVGSPSAGKSPAMDAAFELVRHAEDRMVIGFDAEQQAHETAKHVPDEWGEGLAALHLAEPPVGFSPAAWRQFLDDAGRFLDRWGADAARLGWSALDVFGVHPVAPAVRYDAMGCCR